MNIYLVRHGETVWNLEKKVQGITDKMGYMLQRDCLLEWRNILNNILFGLEIKGKITQNVKKYCH